MSKELTVVSNNREMISFDAQKTELIKKMVGAELTQVEFEVFIAVARARGLDPLLGQMHAVKRNLDGKSKMVIQVGIDGLRAIAQRTGEYAGCDKTLFEYDEEKRIISAEVTVHRMVKGNKCSFTATADWSEYYPGEKMGFMWRSKPKVMLGKCAEAQALRKAFPFDLSGLYEEAELEVKDVTPKKESDEQSPDEQRDLRITKMLESFAKLDVSAEMIGRKFGIDGRDQLTDEMLAELRTIGLAIHKQGKNKFEFFKSNEPQYEEF